MKNDTSTGITVASHDRVGAGRESSRSRMRSKYSALYFVLLMLFSNSAFAYWCNNPTSYDFTVGLPSTINVPRDAVVGTHLTNWVRAPGQSQRFWTCGMVNQTLGWHYRQHAFTEDSGLTVDGFKVFKTTVEGVGIAVKAWGSYLRDYSPYTTVQSSVWIAYSLDVAGFRYWNSSTNALGYALGGTADVMLVKIGPITPGVMKRVKMFEQHVYGTGDEYYGGGGYSANYYIPEVSIKTAACSTPDVAVNLGSHRESEFANVGSRSGPVKFTLAINNCPAGLGAIKYGFNFSGKNGYSAKDGLFGLTDNSTASGFRVKLMDGAGKNTVELDKWYSLDGYSASTGGSYTVPLSAAYQRTGDMTLGTANAELIIAMNYQ